ncbi:ASKHA domain-containing protein [Lachnospiraceae bacterium 46-15]
MYKVTFKFENSEDVSVFAAFGESLLEVARKTNVAIDAPCSGNASCGKCRVKLIGGELESKKTRHISDEEYADGWRLACVSTICADVEVLVPDIASAYRSRMKVADLSSPDEIKIFDDIKSSIADAGIELKNNLEIIELNMEVPTLDDTMPDNERLTRAVKAEAGLERVKLPYSVLKKLPDILRESDFKVKAVIRKTASDIFVYDIFPASEEVVVAGAAIDIGTTTVSGILINMLDGSILAKGSAGNGQIRYGADVINRIIESDKPGGKERLQKAVIDETLNPLLHGMCRQAKITKRNIYRMCVAGNSTMNHLLMGINANPLRMEPYIPAFFKTNSLFAQDIGIDVNPDAHIIVAPNIGSYVGGDISCGMRATDGAIEACTIDADTMEPAFQIVGEEGTKPIGLCGSGIIDVISELFRCGIIDPKGKFVRDGKRIKRDAYGMGSYVLAFEADAGSVKDVEITEVDIDNFIRAKGAIFSAIRTMLAYCDFDISMIENVYVAGGIGSGINMENAINIGMFPDVPLEMYHYIGNSSLAGAYAMLYSTESERKVYEVAQNMTYIELSAIPQYMDEFVGACFLPHTDTSLFPNR